MDDVLRSTMLRTAGGRPSSGSIVAPRTSRALRVAAICLAGRSIADGLQNSAPSQAARLEQRRDDFACKQHIGAQLAEDVVEMSAVHRILLLVSRGAASDAPSNAN
ncbi:MAG: hypothetical protein ACKVWV_08625 [Planctomycetota bacterium]